jgi:hypothetical protein
MIMTISISSIEMYDVVTIVSGPVQTYECLHNLDQNFTGKRLTCSHYMEGNRSSLEG